MNFLNFFILILLSSCLGKMGNSLGTNESKETSLIQSTNAEASSPAVQGESDAGSGTGSSEMYFDPECGNEPFVATFKLGEEKKVKLENLASGDKITVNWGDGSYIQLLENSGAVERIYDSKEVGDEVEVQISGRYSKLRVYTDSKVQKVSNLGSLCWEFFRFAFSGQDELTILLGGDTSKVIDMGSMFSGASSFNGDLSSFDTSNVTDMGWMFNGASSFNQDLTNFNTSNVTNMSVMFAGARSFNGDLSSFNTEKVTNMNWMFHGASSFNQDLTNFNTSNVTDMRNMFGSASSFNGDLSDFNTSNVTDMGGMFNGASSFNQDLSNFDTSEVKNMSGMFAGASSFNQDLTNFNTSNVIDMGFMFSVASSFNGDLSSFNTEKVTNMYGMFNKASSFNQDLSSFNTEKVTDMRNMFREASSFNADLSSFNTEKVTDMINMFREASSFNQDFSNFNFKNIQGINQLLYLTDISEENYSKFLIRFNNTNEINNDEALNTIGTIQSCYLESAQNARENILEKGWYINDQGMCDDDNNSTTTTTIPSTTSTTIPVCGELETMCCPGLVCNEGLNCVGEFPGTCLVNSTTTTSSTITTTTSSSTSSTTSTSTSSTTTSSSSTTSTTLTPITPLHACEEPGGVLGFTYNSTKVCKEKNPKSEAKCINENLWAVINKRIENNGNLYCVNTYSKKQFIDSSGITQNYYASYFIPQSQRIDLSKDTDSNKVKFLASGQFSCGTGNEYAGSVNSQHLCVLDSSLLDACKSGQYYVFKGNIYCAETNQFSQWPTGFSTCQGNANQNCINSIRKVKSF